MDLRKTFDRILKEVTTESLQPDGFTRRHHLLTRRRRFYVEHFQFQSDRYNVGSMRCRYYLNVGIEYPFLPRAGAWAFRRDNGLVSWLGKKSVSLVYIGPEVVWATRADALIAELPPHWELVPDSDLLRLKTEFAEVIRKTSEAMEPWARSRLGQACFFWMLSPIAWPFYAFAQRRKI